ncbi:MAG: F0F1 ATP synthase subunit B [Gammaproteobacteria bacterium]
MNITATLFGQMLFFVVFVWFTMKFVWPHITAAMAERQKKIAEGLSAAERAAKDLELAQEKAADNLREAKEQAAQIIAQANKRAAEIIDEAKVQARAEGDRLIVAAKAEVDQETHRAREQLRKQVSALAMAGAEKVLARSIDAQAHGELLDKLAAEL